MRLLRASGLMRITVSIHASVKDATSDGSISVFCDEVSIHASVKDATYKKRGLISRLMFQSTHL